VESQSKLKSSSSNLQDVENLSSKQQLCIQQISEVIKNGYSEDELPELKKRLDAINQVAARKMTEEEAAVIYSATSTAYSSYQYWMRNMWKWSYALNFPEILKKYSESQLNDLQILNPSLLKNSTWFDDPDENENESTWWEDTWNSTESWWGDTWDAAEEWWEEDGENIVGSDIGGAVTGALLGAMGAPITAGASVGFTAAAVGLATSAGVATYELMD
jgi:hypothetical protein